jgi:tetratricopeptide (TPR) repeat protein
VAKADVLARVRDDLALGHTYLAIQRLRTLLAVNPNDVEVYRLLASVYRQTGNLVEAGRWAFLTEDLREEELAAFERAHPSPWLRLRLLRWSGEVDGLPEPARGRLRALVQAAEQAGRPDSYRGPMFPRQVRGSTIPCVFVVLVLLIFGTLAGIGLFQAVRFILL